MKRFTSFGSVAGGGNKRKKDKSPSSAAGSLGAVHQQAVDANAFNELEMLRAENAHLKRLIEQRDEQDSVEGAKDAAGEAGARAAAELATLRNQRDQLQRQLSAVTADFNNLQREYHNLQRDRQMEVEELQRKARTLDAQIEFLDRQHEQELQEKDTRIRELEMKVVDLEQEIEIAQSPAAAPQGRQAMDVDDIHERAADTEKRLQLARAEAQRRAEEVERLREELEHIKSKGVDEGSVAALQAERDYLRVQLEEATARARSYQNKAEELDEQLERMSEEIHKKHELVNRLETQLGELRYRASQREEAEGREGATAEDSPEFRPEAAEVAKLKKMLKEKEKAVWDLSDRLLQMSAECDRLQEAQRQQQQQQQGETAAGGAAAGEGLAGSVPTTPTGSGKKDKRPKTAVLEDNQRLLQQVQQLQEEMKKQQHEAEARQRAAQQRVAEMERRAAELERNLQLETQQHENAKERFQQLVKKREAEFAALEVSRETRAQALEVARTVILPLEQPRTGGASEGGEDSSTAASSREDLQVELALKSAALRSLSVKNAHLNDVLQRLRMTSTVEYAEEQLEKYRRDLAQAQEHLVETEAALRAAKAKEVQLQGQMARLRAEADMSQKEAAENRETLRDAQARHSAAADRFKQQNEEYARLLTQAMAEVERLGGELACARVERMEAVKRFREEARSWRANGLQQGFLSVNNKDDSLDKSFAAAIPVAPAAPPAGAVSLERPVHGAATPADGRVGSAAAARSEKSGGRSRQQQLVPMSRRQRLQHRFAFGRETKEAGSAAAGIVQSDSSSTPGRSDASTGSGAGETGGAVEFLLPPGVISARPMPVPDYVEYVVQSAAAARAGGGGHTVVAPVEVCALEEMQQQQRDLTTTGLTTSSSALSFFASYTQLEDGARFSPEAATAARLRATGRTTAAGADSPGVAAVAGGLWGGPIVAGRSRKDNGTGRGEVPCVTPEIQRAAAQYLRDYIELQQQCGKREAATADASSVPPSSPRVESVCSLEDEEEEKERRKERELLRTSSSAPRMRVLPPAPDDDMKNNSGTAQPGSPINIVSRLFSTVSSRKSPAASSSGAAAAPAGAAAAGKAGAAGRAAPAAAGAGKRGAEGGGGESLEQRRPQPPTSPTTQEKSGKASSPRVTFQKFTEEKVSDIVPYPTFAVPATGSSEPLSAVMTATFGSPREHEAVETDTAEEETTPPSATVNAPATAVSSDIAAAVSPSASNAASAAGHNLDGGAPAASSLAATPPAARKARGRSLERGRGRSEKTNKEKPEDAATAAPAKAREEEELNLR